MGPGNTTQDKMQLLDLDADNLKSVLNYVSAMTCRMVCKRFKYVVEQSMEISIMLSESGAKSANQTFLRKFKFLSIGSKYVWSCCKGWFAATLACLRKGMKLKGLRNCVTEENIEGIIKVLVRLLSTHGSCIKTLTLDFSGSPTQLQKQTGNLEALSKKLQILMNWDMQNRNHDPSDFLIFDLLSASFSMRSLNVG
jgi:hypothetical protein